MANGDSVFNRLTCEGTEGPDGSIERSECRFTFDGGTGRFAALISTNEGDAFGEPAHDVEPVQDVFDVGVDGGSLKNFVKI